MSLCFVRKVFVVFVLLLIVSLLVACGIRIGSSQSSSNKHMSSSFMKLSGEDTKKIRLTESGALTITYDIKVESGNLNIKLIDPKGIEVIAFDNTQNGSKEIKIDESGTYNIIVVGKDAKGSYDLRWEAH